MSLESDLLERILELERRVDHLLSHLTASQAVPPLPARDPRELSDEVRGLVAEGRLIEAIKLHRAEAHLSLSEAQAAVEQFAAG